MASAGRPSSVPTLSFGQKIQFLQKILENKDLVIVEFNSGFPYWVKAPAWKCVAEFVRELVGVDFDGDGETQTMKRLWTHLRKRTKEKQYYWQARRGFVDPENYLNQVDKLVLEILGDYDPLTNTLRVRPHGYRSVSPKSVVSAPTTAPIIAPIAETFKKYMKMKKQVDASTSSLNVEDPECSPKEQPVVDSAGESPINVCGEELNSDFSKFVTVFSTEEEAKALRIPPTVNCIGNNRSYPFHVQCCQCRQSVAFLRSPGLWKREDAAGVSPMDLMDAPCNRELSDEWATLESHIAMDHFGGSQEYHCVVCRCKFDCLEDFYRHSYRLLPSGYFCLICRCPFASYGTVKRHLKHRHAITVYKESGDPKCSRGTMHDVRPAPMICSVVKASSASTNSQRSIAGAKNEPKEHIDQRIPTKKLKDKVGEPFLTEETKSMCVSGMEWKDTESKESPGGSSSARDSGIQIESQGPSSSWDQPSLQSAKKDLDPATGSEVILQKFSSAAEAAEFGARIRILCDDRPFGQYKSLNYIYCGNCPLVERFRFHLIRWDNDLDETLFYYWQHVERCHGNLPLAYKCFVCGEGFADRQAYLSHAFRFPSKGVCCRRCGLTTPRMNFLKLHECEAFDFPADFRHLNRKNASTSDTATSADNWSNSNYSRIIRRSSANQRPKLYRCALCPKVYPTQQGFLYHNKTKHMTKQKAKIGKNNAGKRKAEVVNKSRLSGASKFSKTPINPILTSGSDTSANRVTVTHVASSHSGGSGSGLVKLDKMEICAPVKRASQMSDQLFYVGNETANVLCKIEPSLHADNPDFKMWGSLPVPASEIKCEPCDVGHSSNVASAIGTSENVDNVARDDPLPKVSQFSCAEDTDPTSEKDSKDNALSLRESEDLFNENGWGNASGIEVKIEPVDVVESGLSNKREVGESTGTADASCGIWNGDECGSRSVKCETKSEI